MQTIYITRVRMAGGNDHEHVQAVQWVDADNSSKTGTDTRQTVASWLIQGRARAYVKIGGKAIAVDVVRAQPPYLRTRANGMWTNSLLNLPRC